MNGFVVCDGDARGSTIFGATLRLLFKMRVPVGIGDDELGVFGAEMMILFVFVLRELNTFGFGAGVGDFELIGWLTVVFVRAMGTGDGAFPFEIGLIVRPCDVILTFACGVIDTPPPINLVELDVDAAAINN